MLTPGFSHTHKAKDPVTKNKSLTKPERKIFRMLIGYTGCIFQISGCKINDNFRVSVKHTRQAFHQHNLTRVLGRVIFKSPGCLSGICALTDLQDET